MGLLNDKICLITGTSRGIGAGLLEAFAREGAVVYANARTPGCLDAAAQQTEPLDLDHYPGAAGLL